MFSYYLLFKFAHIVSFVSWMAAMFYLPRLFVYHCEEKFGTSHYKKFCLMEERLTNIIMPPAMISTWIFGILLFLNNIDHINGLTWLTLKLVFVVVLSGLHGFFIKCRKNFLVNKNTHSSKFYKYLNEGPTIIFIIITALAVFKPTL